MNSASIDLPEAFAAMRQREEMYRIDDWIVVWKAITCPTNIEDWRTKMCEWLYQVADHHDCDREIVSLSMNYLDRYMMSTCPRRQTTPNVFHLLAITCLYLACKIQGESSPSLPISDILQLSAGRMLTKEMVIAMEVSILGNLSWQVLPPTALTFAKHFILLLPPSKFPTKVWNDLMDRVEFLTELSVIDYSLALKNYSIIGLAAVMAALDMMPPGFHMRLSRDLPRTFPSSQTLTARIRRSSPFARSCD